MKETTSFHSRCYRVIRRTSRKHPDYWAVQATVGYTNGTIAWRLATSERFWSSASATAWIDHKISSQSKNQEPTR